MPPCRSRRAATLLGALVGLAVLVAGAAPAAQPLVHVPPAALPGWAEDDLAGLASAIERQCRLPRPPAGWSRTCAMAPAQGAALKGWIAGRFRARALSAADGALEGLITGYHEPELTGSRRRMSAAQVPLYRPPAGALAAARPTRAQIENDGLLAGTELVWLDDPVEAFFLQVQGSGRVRLREGGLMRVGYAGDNGQPYRAIGRELVERGALDARTADAPAIKAWLRDHPVEARDVMQSNPRYVFFRELPPMATDAGPPGSLGVPLTPLRSVATDPAFVPPGALLWLETTHPLDGRPLRRAVLAQDTGAAIRGPVRADVFWGTGPEAAVAAGQMRGRGRLWLLEPVD